MLNNFKKELSEKRELYVRVKARPGASQTVVAGIMDDGTIKMSIAAVPERGKANAELIKFLSKEFGIEKNKIKIISGQADRLKLIRMQL